MKATFIDKAKKVIQDKRYYAEQQAQNNKTLALKDLSFRGLYLDYVDHMIEDAKNGLDEQPSTLALKKLCFERLKELNIPYIKPKYFCPKCNDTGFIEGKYCDCLIEEINRLLIENSGFTKLESFEEANFDIFENKEFIQKLYAKMKQWCNSNFDKNLVFLSGQTGVGKTHLMKCMANELICLHKVVLLTSSFAMHQDFIKSYSCKDLVEKQALLEKYLNAEVLFIDDLGTELRQHNITINYLYQILNERKMAKKPTIITSNLNISDIMDYYDERISSRIADKNTSICVYISGEDLRLKLNK